MHIIPHHIVRALGWALLHSLWQGLIIAVLAGVILILTKKAKAALRYNLLCCLLLLSLGISGVTLYRELRVPAEKTVVVAGRKAVAGTPAGNAAAAGGGLSAP